MRFSSVAEATLFLCRCMASAVSKGKKLYAFAGKLHCFSRRLEGLLAVTKEQPFYLPFGEKEISAIRLRRERFNGIINHQYLA